MMPSGSNVVGISHSMLGTEPDPPPPIWFVCLSVCLFFLLNLPMNILQVSGTLTITWWYHPYKERKVKHGQIRIRRDLLREFEKKTQPEHTQPGETRSAPDREPRSTFFFLFVHQCHWFSIRRRGNGFVRSENRVGFLGCWLLATTFEPISSLKIPTLMTSPRYRMFHNWTIEWTHRTRSCWFEWTECGPLFQINSFFSHVHTSWFF